MPHSVRVPSFPVYLFIATLDQHTHMHLSSGDKKKAPQPSPYSIFTKSDLEERVVCLFLRDFKLASLTLHMKAKLTEEVDGLKAKSTARNTVEGKHVGTINESEPMSITA